MIQVVNFFIYVNNEKGKNIGGYIKKIQLDFVKFKLKGHDL